MKKRNIADQFVTKIRFSKNLVNNVESSYKSSIREINVKYKRAS